MNPCCRQLAPRQRTSTDTELGTRMVNRVMRAPADVSTPRIRTMGNGSSRVGGKEACNPAAGVAAGGVVVSLGVAVGPGVGVDGGGAGGAAWMTAVCSSAW